MKKITKKMIRTALNEGWSKEDASRGYGIFTGLMGDAEHIEKIDSMDVFESDDEAAEQAEKDGIAIIHDLPAGLDEWDSYGIYIDTPENRTRISEYLEKKYQIKWA